MRGISIVAAIATASLAAATASAHQGNPNMESVVRSISPHPKGLTIGVLNRDDRFELINGSGRRVTIEGYEGEPYARVLGGGEVQVNVASPAYYLNNDRYGQVEVPKSADADASPRWKTLDRTGRFQWHDHRMHYMGAGTPPSVRDESVRQKVFDYEIPLMIGSARGRIAGTLWWTPTPGGRPPLGAIVALGLLVMMAVTAALLVRRRRGDETREAW